MAVDSELKQVWEEFAKRIDSKFDYDETVFLGGDKFKCQIQSAHADVVINFLCYQHRTATISTFSKKVFTKVFVPFDKGGDFQFSLYPESIGTKVLKAVGLQDVQIGIPKLDQKFIFRGNNKRLIQKTFGNTKIAKLLLTEYDYNLKIKKGRKLTEFELPENKDFLIFESDLLIRDVQLLEYLLQIFTALMDELKDEIRTGHNKK